MKVIVVFILVLHITTEIYSLFLPPALLDLPRGLLKCFMFRKSYGCPHEDIGFVLYTPKSKRGKLVDVRKPKTFVKAGYIPEHETAIIIHGFNGTQTSEHIMYLKDAYLSRRYNVIAVDWERLTTYPCYLSSLSNTKLVSQCTAQLYSFLTYMGSKIEDITCVGHSLGAHICGMMSNHLTSKQHRIIGLDPARPLIQDHGTRAFRLTRDDAYHVQIILTNAGFLGQSTLSGSVNYCINGGRDQPYCTGNKIKRSRCSHFLAVCYLANAIFHNKKNLGVPCPRGCVMNNRFPFIFSHTNEIDLLSGKLRYFKLGQDTPDYGHGTYCIRVEHANHCPFH
ncbi:CLUMA_CG017788, isoform A [Clunio marinus]|uniref:CLUMA_CG017788, isoform A n=1 Tax=Clunio marinus TaxID=568069 RepID=A0A1J1IXA1_9DIPT|nr:CLUMA_CG017788, isoform A [Clunio marinus]